MSTTQKQPRGCANSSDASLSRTVLSMSGQLPKWMRGACRDIRNAISSLGSEDGALPCSLPDGPQTDLFGQALAPASRSAPQEKVSRKRTNATSGPCSSSLSASAALSMSLGSRLRQRLVTVGSMEYRQTWKQRVTPAGRPYWAHTASTRPIKDSGSTGRPTPDTCAGGTGPSQKDRHAMRLQDAVLGWTTPNARDYKDSASPEALMRAMDSEKGSANLPRQEATIVGWCSPTVTDAARGVMPPRPQDTGIPLTQQVAGLTGWATPQAADNVEGARTALGSRQKCLGQDIKHLGPTTNSSTVETGKPAASQLNPHFSRWLMGFPPEWCDCAATAMQSFPKRQRSLSKHIER